MRTLAVAVALLVALTACGGSTPTAPKKAAEPAKSPAVTVTPAGTVAKVGANPEGAVFDPTTGLLAVAVRSPNRVLLIDGATGVVQKEIALPGHARHLKLAGPGGPLLVPAENSDSLIEVSLPDGAVTKTAVGTYPHDAAKVANGDIVVADELGGSLSVVRDGAVVKTFSDLKQPGGLAPFGNLVGAVDVGTFDFSVYDLVAQKRVARLAAGAGPTHDVTDKRGHVVVLDTRGNAVLTFSLSPAKLLSTVPLAGTPYGITYDAARDVVWVSLTARNEVVGLSLAGGKPKEVARFPTVRQPNTLATDPASGRVWVLGRTTGELQTITP